MKINDNMRFPHPILSDITNDYTKGSFESDFTITETENRSLKLTSKINIESPRLSELIQDGKVAVGYYLICRETFYDELHVSILGESEIIIPQGMLFGSVIIRPIAWTTSSEVDLSTLTLNPEFSVLPILAKGEIVALGPEYRFSMDPKKYKPLGSIFELTRNDNLPAGIFHVDTEGDIIRLVAEKNTFENIVQLRNTHNRNLLLGSIYLAALVDVLSRMSTSSNDEGKTWYRVLKAKYDELGLDLLQTTPSEGAQMLLKRPIQELFAVVEHMNG
ncbi:hypothetical protein [Acinetobacter pseudolwoffii]|uniref:Uncharacterized protein n=1 Tax=Acinetobacter pseudolwoffii TaxID=2053287 RepID=A0A2H9YPK1_9GAMM|nr:hypothetical protein [Acinetobacter pseudolwoffii]PJO74584.1 hypothetical protein CWI32_12665 [Acinetobacter pseudolwoffii]